MAKARFSNSSQTFHFRAPEASSVQLVGDFTHWTTNPINLGKQPDGVWKVTLELAPGTYHYRFLVDGQWHDDPECTLRVANPYGSADMVREVQEAVERISQPAPVSGKRPTVTPRYRA